MSTETLRARVRAGAASLGATRHVWPNAIGFDWRGWEYSISEPDGLWRALRRSSTNAPSRHGKGLTPHEARTNARPMDY